MTASAGRSVTLTWGSNSPPEGIAGVKEKDLTLNGAPIDISSDDDNGWRALLTVPGQKQVDLKVSGVTKDRALIADWFAGTLTQAAVLTYSDGSTISGQFYLSEYSEKGNFKDAVAFDATLMSTGAVTFMAGA